jgi:hypothetical protein
MDPIQPIGPRPPWLAELVAEQTQSTSRERRRSNSERSTRDRGRGTEPPREPPHEQLDDPEDDEPGGRHIDVRA